LVLGPPERSERKEMFRRFEFRALLGRVDLLDAAVPAAELEPVEGAEIGWRGGDPQVGDGVGFAAMEGRCAVATEDEVIVGDRPSRLNVRVVCHDAKSLRVTPLDDTLIAAYLIEPARASYELDDLAAEYAVEITPSPEADEETTALVRRAALPLHLAPLMRRRLGERGPVNLYETGEPPPTEGAPAPEGAGRTPAT